MTNRQQFLETPSVQQFVSAFSEYVYGHRQLDHCYTEARGNVQFAPDTMERALHKYSWQGNTYVENSQLLAPISNGIRDALALNDERHTLAWSLKALEWGGVYRGAVGWLAGLALSGELVGAINTAVTTLESEVDDGLAHFKNHTPLRSDSGTTKIFALASSKSVIYDDRVAAALAMFVVRHLSSSGQNSIPEELNFLCSNAGQNRRNPGSRTYRFRIKQTLQGIERGYRHAQSNLYANWIIEEVVQNVEFSWTIPGVADQPGTIQERVRAVEAALFMIGYRVN